jgi:hypothetical protein
MYLPESFPSISLREHFTAAVGDVSLADVVVPNPNEDMPPLSHYRLTPITPPASWLHKPGANLGFFSEMPPWVKVEKYEPNQHGQMEQWTDIHIDGQGGVGITFRPEDESDDDTLVAVCSAIHHPPDVLEVVQFQGIVRDDLQPEHSRGLHGIRWQNTLLRTLETAAASVGFKEIRINPFHEHGDAGARGRSRTSYARTARQEGYDPVPDTKLWAKRLSPDKP